MLQLRPSCECCNKGFHRKPRKHEFVLWSAHSAHHVRSPFLPATVRTAVASYFLVLAVPYFRHLESSDTQMRLKSESHRRLPLSQHPIHCRDRYLAYRPLSLHGLSNPVWFRIPRKRPRAVRIVPALVRPTKDLHKSHRKRVEPFARFVWRLWHTFVFGRAGQPDANLSALGCDS